MKAAAADSSILNSEPSPKSFLLPLRHEVSKFHEEYILMNQHFVIPHMRDWWLSGISDYLTYRSGLNS